MFLSRVNHQCGVITTVSGTKKFVIAGGKVEVDWDYYHVDTVEIIDLDTNTWVNGPSMPVMLTDATSVPFGDTFLAVGGLDEDGVEQKSIYEYSPFDGEWIKRPEELKHARSNPGVSMSTTEYVQCD